MAKATIGDSLVCFSIADGGQRCAHHTRSTLSAKTAAMEALAGAGGPALAAAQSEWEDAAAAYASTGAGHADLTQRAQAAHQRGDLDRHALLSTLVRRGEVLREVNETSRALTGSQGLDVGWPEGGMGPKAYAQVRAGDLAAGDVILAEGSNHLVEATETRGGGILLRLRDARGRRKARHADVRSMARKLVVGVLGAVMALGAAGGTASALRGEPNRAPEAAPQPVEIVAPPAREDRKQKVAPRVPAPTTVAGYERMFSRVDTAQWGGADISYSVDLPDGRRVWLYGDTVSGNHGLVRNTAIVQDGGRLHVSHGGEQVLPSDPTKNGRTTIYWPETASVGSDGDLRIVAAPISAGTKSVWDFHRTGPATKSRVAVVDVDAEGNLTFRKWTGWQNRPDIDYDETGPSDIRILGPNHWGYAETTHPNITLADGSRLVTMSQNWDDSFDAHRNPDGSLRYRDWRPLFYSTTNLPPT